MPRRRCCGSASTDEEATQNASDFVVGAIHTRDRPRPTSHLLQCAASPRRFSPVMVQGSMVMFDRPGTAAAASVQPPLLLQQDQSAPSK
jgi:hypothetical protein